MATPKPMQFIVQGEPVRTGLLAEHLKVRPAVQQVAQVASDVVILSMTVTEAERLRTEFDSLVVEPDSPLNQNQR